MYLLLSTIVLNSRDWWEIYCFPWQQPYNNISFEYWQFIYWYKAIGSINLFRYPKHAFEMKLWNFIFCKLQVFCLSACQPASLPAWRVQHTFKLCTLWLKSVFKIQNSFQNTNQVLTSPLKYTKLVFKSSNTSIKALFSVG